MSPLDPLFVNFLLSLCAAAAAVGCLYSLVTSIVIARWRTAKAAPHCEQQPVTVLKPLHGEEPNLLPRLAAFCLQDYQAETQIVFGVEDRRDPVVSVVAQLRASFPDRDIAFSISSASFGVNRKISNLVNMNALARHEIIVLSDSDIEVKRDYLSKVTDALQQPGVGGVTCLYHGVPGRSLPSVISSLAINVHFLPNAVAAIFFGLVRPCFGSTIALTRETLTRIGGFCAFADRLADDFLIGEAVQASGCKLAIPTFTVGHACHETTFQEFFFRQLRCARTIKALDPIGYAGAVIANPLPLALIASLQLSRGSFTILGAAALCRLIQCQVVERTFALPRQKYLLLPLVDVSLFIVFVASFFGSSVVWRGHRYRLDGDRLAGEDAFSQDSEKAAHR